MLGLIVFCLFENNDLTVGSAFMNCMFIGDLHGYPAAAELRDNQDFRSADEVVFLGDYLDSYHYTVKQSLANFEALIELAREFRSAPKVTLLIGNHDAHYFLWKTPLYKSVRSSGFSSSAVYKAYHLYVKNADLFKAAWQHDTILATHAGLSNTSFAEHISGVKHKSFEGENLAFKLNAMYAMLHPSIFAVGKLRWGSCETGSILWADRRETMNDALQGYHQVVGHSPIQAIMNVQDPKHPHTSITYTDVMRLTRKLSYYLIAKDGTSRRVD